MKTKLRKEKINQLIHDKAEKFETDSEQRFVFRFKQTKFVELVDELTKIAGGLKLIQEMKTYIENAEVSKDAECGPGRDVEELIKDNDMPELWHKLMELIETD